MPIGAALAGLLGSYWDPSLFPSLTGWWDADSLSGQSDATTVTSWTDESGNGRTMTNVSGSPTKQTRNGYTTILINNSSSGEILQTGAGVVLSTLVGDTGLVAGVAEATTDAPSGANYWNGNAVFQDNDAYYHMGHRSANWEGSLWDGAAKTVAISSTNNERTLFMQWRTSGSVLNFGINGAAPSTLGSVGAPSTQTARCGVYFDGYVYELVTSTANGTENDRARLAQYLTHKYAIS